MDNMFNDPRSKEQMTYVTVRYEENKPETYSGLEITLPDGEVHILNTGEFLRDYMRAIEEYEPFYKSSTVDTYMRETGIGLN